MGSLVCILLNCFQQIGFSLHGCDGFALKGEMLVSVCISCIVFIDANSASILQEQALLTL